MYVLTKQHIMYRNNGIPVLLSADFCSGPYSHLATLPFAGNSRACDFVTRHLLGQLLRTDPGLQCDEGEDLHTYCCQYLAKSERLTLTVTVTSETIRKAKILAAAKKCSIDDLFEQLLADYSQPELATRTG